MNAGAVLAAVAAVYSKLTSLSIELVTVVESGDDEGFSRSEQRGKAFFVAPDKVRIEQGGRRGNVIVTDGIDLHHCYGCPARYSRSSLPPGEPLPGAFRPEFPITNGVTFLFNRIAERVAAAEVLEPEPARVDRSDAACYRIAVMYEPPPYPALTVSGSPLIFWIDSKTHLVLRVEGEKHHRRPAHEETQTSKVTLLFTRTTINEPIRLETFQFSPPPDATDITGPGGGTGCVSTAGCGSARFDAARGGQFENWHSHDWAGSTLIDTSKLRLHGLNLTFERRLTLSDDRRQMHVVERITSPAGQSAREFSIPVA